MKADSPTGATHSKGAMKHFWIDIDGEVFDPSYTQYVIGKTKLPDHSLGNDYSSPRHSKTWTSQTNHPTNSPYLLFDHDWKTTIN